MSIDISAPVLPKTKGRQWRALSCGARPRVEEADAPPWDRLVLLGIGRPRPTRGHYGLLGPLSAAACRIRSSIVRAGARDPCGFDRPSVGRPTKVAATTVVTSPRLAAIAQVLATATPVVRSPSPGWHRLSSLMSGHLDGSPGSSSRVGKAPHRLVPCETLWWWKRCARCQADPAVGAEAHREDLGRFAREAAAALPTTSPWMQSRSTTILTSRSRPCRPSAPRSPR